MIDLKSPYYKDVEKKAIAEFLTQGYVIFSVEEPALQEEMKTQLLILTADFLRLKTLNDDGLDKIHEVVSPVALNGLRLHVIQHLSKDESFKLKYFHLARENLSALVGNELCMQRVCNLSIQMPHDTESLLPLHADTWSGNSPYEVVFWLPFTDCYKTRSMFVLPLEKSRKIYRDFSQYSHLSSEELFKVIEEDVIWLEIPYGHGLIFSHTLLHGNRVNVEDGTRWSFNMRFKSLLTPFEDKALGETFFPITMRPLTQLGFQYEAPKV
jgi:sporadic carbohydrate cluster 2OG-Fe(II) oxygenase